MKTATPQERDAVFVVPYLGVLIIGLSLKLLDLLRALSKGPSRQGFDAWSTELPSPKILRSKPQTGDPNIVPKRFLILRGSDYNAACTVDIDTIDTVLNQGAQLEWTATDRSP